MPGIEVQDTILDLIYVFAIFFFGLLVRDPDGYLSGGVGYLSVGMVVFLGIFVVVNGWLNKQIPGNSIPRNFSLFLRKNGIALSVALFAVYAGLARNPYGETLTFYMFFSGVIIFALAFVLAVKSDIKS